MNTRSVLLAGGLLLACTAAGANPARFSLSHCRHHYSHALESRHASYHHEAEARDTHNHRIHRHDRDALEASHHKIQDRLDDQHHELDRAERALHRGHGRRDHDRGSRRDHDGAGRLFQRGDHDH